MDKTLKLHWENKNVLTAVNTFWNEGTNSFITHICGLEYNDTSIAIDANTPEEATVNHNEAVAKYEEMAHYSDIKNAENMDLEDEKATQIAMDNMSRNREEFCIERLIALGLNPDFMKLGQIYCKHWDNTDINYFEYLYGQRFIFGELITYPIRKLGGELSQVSMAQRLFDKPQTHDQIYLMVEESEGEESISLGRRGKNEAAKAPRDPQEQITTHVDRERKVMLKKLGFRQDLFERGMVVSSQEEGRPFYYEHRRAESGQFIFSEILMVTNVGGKPGFAHILYPKRLRDDQYQKAMRGERI